jgi:hypothetical protein
LTDNTSLPILSTMLINGFNLTNYCGLKAHVLT